MYSELRAQHELMVSYSGSLWLWKFWSFGFGLCHDEGHGGHCVGNVMLRAMEAFVLVGPWWTLIEK